MKKLLLLIAIIASGSTHEAHAGLFGMYETICQWVIKQLKIIELRNERAELRNKRAEQDQTIEKLIKTAKMENRDVKSKLPMLSPISKKKLWENKHFINQAMNKRANKQRNRE